MIILKPLIKNYIKDQYQNYGRFLYFCEGQKELLSGGEIYFYSKDSFIPLSIWTDNQKKIDHCNPVIANAIGEFPLIYLDGDYTVKVHNKDEKPLLIINTGQVSEVFE